MWRSVRCLPAPRGPLYSWGWADAFAAAGKPMSAKVYVHPRCFARRAAEIARSQGATIERDARGRPFIVPADPLAPPAVPAEVQEEPGRLDRLIRALWGWLPPIEEPGRLYRNVEKPRPR